MFDELRQERLDGAVFRNEEHIALELSQCASRSPKLREKKIFHVNQSDGAIERSFAKRISRVPRRANDFQVLGDRFRRRKNRDVRARHHDLPRGSFRELENALDDLAVLLGKNSCFLRAGEDESQLFLRMRDLRSRCRLNAQNAEHGVGCSVENPDHRKHHHIKTA